MINLIKDKRFKIGIISLVAIFFMTASLLTSTSVLIALVSILDIVAILLYAKYSWQSVVLFLFAEVLSIVELKTGITNVAFILIAGVLVILANKAIKSRGVTLISVIKSKNRPRSIRFVFRIIMYSLFVTSIGTVSRSFTTLDGTGLTLLSSVWLIVPTFYTIATVLMISDMYILRMMYQVILGVLNYMQFTLGKCNYISVVTTLITFVVLIVGHIEFKSILEQERVAKEVEDKKSRELTKSIDKLEPME